MTTPPNNLRYFRGVKGLTLVQVADMAGTTHEQVRRLENGTRRLTHAWMIRLSKVFGCTPADLIAETKAARRLSGRRVHCGQKLTAGSAIAVALMIEDHYDRLEFLRAFQNNGPLDEFAADIVAWRNSGK